MKPLLKMIIGSATLILLIGLVSMVKADEITATGRLGGAEVYSAKILPKGSFALGYEEEYFQNKQILFDQKNDFHGSRIFITTSPFENIQVFLNRRTFLNNNIKLFSALNSVTYSQSELGTILSKEVSTHHFLAFEPTVVLFNANRVKFFEASSFSVRGLYTHETLFGEEKSPVRFHANLQYFMNEGRKVLDKFDFSGHTQKTLYGLSRYYSVRYGLGLEMELEKFSPYIEYSLDQMLRVKVPFLDNPNRLSIGAKFRPFDPNWVLHIGSNFGFAYDRHDDVSSTPNFSGFVGLSYFPKEKREKISKKQPVVSITPKKEEYPIYPLTPTEEIQSPKKPVIRVAEQKLKKKKKTKIEKLERKFISDDVLKQSLPKVNIPSTTKVKTQNEPTTAPTNDFSGLENRNANEESPDRDFLLHFR